LGKVFGIYLTAEIFNLDWSLQNSPESFLSVKPVFAQTDIAIVSSYSDLLMYIFILAGLSFTLFSAVYLHSSHIDPKVVAKLANNNLMHLIKDSFDLYLGGSMWLLFSWIATGTIFVNVLLEKTYTWVLLSTFLTSVLFSILLLHDVAKEIEISRKRISIV
jgi:hypothetical protein